MIKSAATPISWLERHLGRSREVHRVHEEERLVLDATEAIEQAMEARGVTRSGLAELLGTSKANVSQLLSGTRNLTLRTLGRMAFELNYRLNVELADLDEVAYQTIEVDQPSVFFSTEINMTSVGQAELLGTAAPSPVPALSGTAEHSIAALAA
jgi:antitoxin component HigA of HigAB toxin-antitoxin module